MKALLKTAEDAGSPLTVLRAVEDINQSMRKRFFGKVARYFGGELGGRKIAVWGIAFKPNTDDTREAPVFYIIDELLKGDAEVTVYDPEAMAGARGRYGDRVKYAESSYGALQGADALIVATEWNEFRKPDFGLMKNLMKQPVLFDGRNIYCIGIRRCPTARRTRGRSLPAPITGACFSPTASSRPIGRRWATSAGDPPPRRIPRPPSRGPASPAGALSGNAGRAGRS